MLVLPNFYGKIISYSIELDIDIITPSDFTLWIKGLPENLKSADLKQWLINNSQCQTRHNSIEIVRVVWAYNIK